MKILFVCRGNVGRSQMAEALFRKHDRKGYEVISAGTKLSGPEELLSNLPLAEYVLTVLKEDGADVSTVMRNQVTPEMAVSADKIVLVIDENDPVPDYLLNDPKVIRWTVSDPKGTDLARHREIRDKIEELIIKELVGKM